MTTLLYHLIRNTLFGGLASLLVWAGYAPASGFGSTDIQPQHVGTALAVGGGGMAIVNGYFRQTQQAEVIDSLADDVTELAQQAEQDDDRA